jgi:hypothetical protein
MIRPALWAALGGALLATSAVAAPPAGADKNAAGGINDPRALAAKIDRLIADRWADAGAKPAPLADDAEFLRRVSLDVAGRIPSVAETRAFLADKSPDKRLKAVERLLEGPAYVNHFASVWQALLVPEDNAANFQLRFFMPAFEAWLRKQFADNVPYDRLVRELITARVANDPNTQQFLRAGGGGEPSPLAFYMAKDVKPEELAAATSRLFLGVKLECAQCHNHPFAKWSRQQFWEYAAFFAGLQKQGDGFFTPVRDRNDRREIAIPNSTQVVQASFLDGKEPQWKYKVGPRVTLAEWMTAPDNPYFARAAANRLWSVFFGLGIVEPVDDLGDDNAQPSHPELLNELARQFVASGFDIKFMVKAITLSRAYQLTSAQTDPSQEDPRLFAHMAVKGLTAEQLFDSLSLATGYRETRFPNQPFVINNGTPRSEFVSKFGSHDKPTEVQTSILQALALMNGKFVADATNVERSEALAAIADAPFLDTAGRLEALYLAAVSRKPTADELDRLVKYVNGGGPKHNTKTALADVFWALLNSSEFILNH